MVEKGKRQLEFYKVLSINKSISFFSANLGGVFNLVFGLSMLSLMEIVYVLTVRLWYHYKKQTKLAKIVQVLPNKKPQSSSIQRFLY